MSTIIDTLKAARGNESTVSRLREGSLDKQIADLREALANPEFSFGPADMVGAFGKITSVVGTKNGVTFRAVVEERDGKLVLGEDIETFDVALPASDVASEVLQTAKLAVEQVLDGNMDGAATTFEAIARSLHLGGDLSRKVRLNVNRQALAVNDPWYRPMIESNYEGEAVEVTVMDPDVADESERARIAVEELLAQITDAMDEAAVAFEGVEEHDLRPEQSLMAHDIIRDAKRARKALEDVDKTSNDEMVSVFEAVQARAGSLVKGLRFLAQLVEGTEETQE